MIDISWSVDKTERRSNYFKGCNLRYKYNLLTRELDVKNKMIKTIIYRVVVGIGKLNIFDYSFTFI